MGKKQRRKMWQANTENFLKRIQKTTFSSSFVYGRGLNIWDLALGEKKRKKGVPGSLGDRSSFPQAPQAAELGARSKQERPWAAL